jgi:8-oxo-dGTP pyrophosphatase MutT (NUDIX family)
MENSKQAMFQISLKVLMRNGNNILLTRGEGGIDLPGGRIDVGEENAPLKDAIFREIREELGEDVKFHLASVLFVHRLGYTKEKEGIMNIVFDAEYLSGDIKLSDEHVSYEWVDGRSYEISRDDFYPEDQEKYEAFKNHFNSLRNK